ncbi:uncharacterized protein si:dkey-262k9.2 isoform X2 [Brienomyrus brachyistius]|uniref:uncharacterized protein si:dkey-262k9.2 isoform X2 n=2 Tax=Brienomyrus brachyistius TaxID=42636 RepID=UPI0020B1CB09|nr:uncharacterized protein si:dkey-262k9.2 isoform X2 [Brienomyrus brachyistius]
MTVSSTRSLCTQIQEVPSSTYQGKTKASKILTRAGLSCKILKMLKLLVLCLIIKATVSAVEMDETEGSADIGSDDEDYHVKRTSVNHNLENAGNSDKSRGDINDGVTTIIIIAAASTTVLILVVIGAIFLVKHHMHNLHQGMYAVPAEQAQKGTI